MNVKTIVTIIASIIFVVFFATLMVVFYSMTIPRSISLLTYFQGGAYENNDYPVILRYYNKNMNRASFTRELLELVRSGDIRQIYRACDVAAVAGIDTLDPIVDSAIAVQQKYFDTATILHRHFDTATTVWKIPGLNRVYDQVHFMAHVRLIRDLREGDKLK